MLIDFNRPRVEARKNGILMKWFSLTRIVSEARGGGRTQIQMGFLFLEKISAEFDLLTRKRYELQIKF